MRYTDKELAICKGQKEVGSAACIVTQSRRASSETEPEVSAVRLLLTSKHHVAEQHLTGNAVLRSCTSMIFMLSNSVREIN